MLMGSRSVFGNMAMRRTRSRFIDTLDRVDILDVRFHILLPGRDVVSIEVLLRNDVLELPFDVGGGLLERRAADIPPLERIVGQELDVTPPPFAFGGRGLEDKGGHSYQQVSQIHACALDG